MIAYILIGILIGLLASFIFIKLKPTNVDGLLGVDTRDADKDYYDFVFLIPTDDIPKRKYLTIEVKSKS